MPSCASTVRSLPRDLSVGVDEEVDALMARIDRDEVQQVCRHLLGDLAPAGARGDAGAPGSGR